MAELWNGKRIFCSVGCHLHLVNKNEKVSDFCIFQLRFLDKDQKRRKNIKINHPESHYWTSSIKGSILIL